LILTKEFQYRMNAIDYLLIAILLVSLFLGFFRGFLNEAIALISWLGGLWLAWHYAYMVVPHLGGLVKQAPWNIWTGRLLIMLSVLVLGWLIAGIASYFAHQSGISLMLDRLLGVLFGVIRGLVIIAIAVMLALQVQLDRTDWWRGSRFMPIAVEVSGWIKGFADSAVKREKAQPDAAVEA
jgi:membrane protein required for colicin V production